MLHKQTPKTSQIQSFCAIAHTHQHHLSTKNRQDACKHPNNYCKRHIKQQQRQIFLPHADRQQKISFIKENIYYLMKAEEEKTQRNRHSAAYSSLLITLHQDNKQRTYQPDDKKSPQMVEPFFHPQETNKILHDFQRFA